MERPVLITGLIAITSLFLSCLLAATGSFNLLISIVLITANLCFFILVALSLSKKLIAPCEGRDAPISATRKQTKAITFVAITVPIIIYAFILIKNTSPSENLLGNHDQGMYLAAAAHLATEGGLSMNTSWISQSKPESRRFFSKKIVPSLKTESHEQKTNSGTQAGFYLMNEKGESQFIQFPIGYPTLLANFYKLGGYNLAQYSNAIICLACGLLLASISLSYLGKIGAISTWLLFLFCPLTVWSANHLYAEPALLLMWLTALLALTSSGKYPLLSALLASAALAAGFLIKIDALPVIAMPLVYALLSTKNSFRVAFPAFSLGLYALVSIAHLHYAKPYFEFTLYGLFSKRLLFILAGFAPLITLLLIPGIRAKIFQILKHNERQLRFGFAIVIGLFFLYLYLIRPYGTEPHLIFSNALGTEIESLREQTFFRLGWYLTPFGLALACIGILTTCIIRISGPLQALVGVGILFLLYYSYDIHCTPYQPYAMRRLFPYAVPLLCLSIPLAAHHLPQKFLPKIAQLATTSLLTAILLVQFQQISQRLVLRENYSGLHTYLSTISEKLPDDALILISGQDKALQYAAPLRYLFNKECILIYPDYRDRNYHKAMKELIERSNRPTYVLSASPNNRLNMRVEIESTEKLLEPPEISYSGTGTGYPENDTKTHEITLYLTKLNII